MADSSDDDFFEALAGRPSPALPEHERRRIELLRDAIRAREGSAEAPAATTRAGLDRLLFRLRREGLLQKRRALMPYAVAALLALVVGTLVLDPASWMRGTVEAPPVVRGDGGVQVIETDDAEARLASIARALQSQGVDATIYPLGVHQGLNASVPPERRDAVAAALKPLGIELPVNGQLRLEIRRKQ
jgi:hypothetical protein